MIFDMLSNLSEDAMKELRERHPEKNQHIVNTIIAMTDIGVDMLRESPEFRRAFARIHNEFLKYPESQETIEQALRAQKEFGPGPV